MEYFSSIHMKPPSESITSRKNPRIQQIKKLLSSAALRQSEGVFIVEGVRLVEEALNSGWALREILVSTGLNTRGRDLFDMAASVKCNRYEVSEAVMAEISDTETPQGIVAVLGMRELPLPDKLEFALVLDAIRDPGNVGTILRTASAAGVNAVLIAPETADPFSPKVLRAGMGAQLKLPVWDCDWPTIKSLVKEKASLKVFLADMGKGVVLWEAPLKEPIALIICNEANGPSPAARALADEVITIPMPGDSESLNAAIAASLLVYEVLRQRQVDVNP
jgi:RNA methyltransferase, TrmH family